MSRDQQLYDFLDGDPDFDLDFHQDCNYPDPAKHLSPSYLATILLVAIPVIYQILYKLDYKLLPIPELLWNIIVYIVPSRLLDAIERYQNPLRMANPMLQGMPRTHAMKSESMRRIFGLDTPDGIMGSVAQAGRRRLSTFSSVGFTAKGPEARPAGLGNWDNSCYQNSVLQGLASLDSLSGYLKNPVLETDTSLAKKPDLRMADALRGLIATLNDPSNNGKRIWTPATLKNMSSLQQQDAQEYFSRVLDEIDKEIQKIVKSTRKSRGLKKEDGAPENETPPSISRNPLEGLMAQRVGCTRCGYSEGLSMIPFNCLTVPLGTTYRGYDISECLHEGTKLELIEGVECGKCTLLKYQSQLRTIAEQKKDMAEGDQIRKTTSERLEAALEALENDDYDDKTLAKKFKIGPERRVSSLKTRQAVIARPPQSLVVHFQRSLFNELTGDLMKNNAGVRFPKVLDLGPWCLGSAGTVQDLESEEWVLDPNASMIASTAKKSRLRGPLYELRAVVTHQGRHENGHYVCFRKHPMVKENEKDPAKDQWWRLSDDDVYKVSEESVLNQGNVFMLFFDLIRPAQSHSAILEVSLESPTLEKTALELPKAQPLEPSVETVSSEEVELAVKVPLPVSEDADFLESETASQSTEMTRRESANTNFSEKEESGSTNQERVNIYHPTNAIMVPQCSQPSGVDPSEDAVGKENMVASGNLVMV